MEDIFNYFCKIKGIKAIAKPEPALIRQTDKSPILDTERIKEIGWVPQIPFEKTLSDIWESV